VLLKKTLADTRQDVTNFHTDLRRAFTADLAAAAATGKGRPLAGIDLPGGGKSR